MGITASELLKAIRSARSDGGFALVLAQMASHAIDDLAGRYVPRATLRLTGVTPPEEAGDGQAVTVRGMGVDAPFAGMAVEALFSMVGGEIALRLTATAPVGWRLTSSFADLTGTMAADLSFSTAPKLVLRSHPGDGKGAGLWFDGTLDLEKTTGGLSKLLGLAEQPIKGTIEMRDAARVVGVDLQAPLCGPIDLKLVTIDELTFRVGSHLTCNPFTRVFSAVPYVGMSGSIPFSAQGQSYSLPLSVQVADLGRNWRFEAGIEDGIRAAWAEVAHLAARVGLKDLDTGEIPLGDVLTLENFAVEVDMSLPTKIAFVKLGVQNKKPFKIYHIDASNKDINLDGFLFSVGVHEPFDGDKRSAWADLSGEISLGKAAVLRLSARLPNPTFRGGLKEGTTIRLDELAAELGAAAADVPAISVSELDVEISKDRFVVDAVLESSWRPGDASVGIEEVRCSIRRIAGVTALATEGKVRIGGIEVLVSADYGDSGKGWQFAGSTGPGQRIPIGTLIKDVATRFKVPAALPSPIASLTIDKFSISFNTKSQRFTFDAVSSFRVDDQTVAIGVSVDLAQGGGKDYSRNLGGSLSFGSHKFGLKFLEDSSATGGVPSDTIVGTYKEKGSLDLNSLVASASTDLEALIPNDLKIDLKDALFAYNKVKVEEKDVSTFLFGIDLDISAAPSLADLPLVGKLLPADASIAIQDLRVLVASQEISTELIGTFNGLLLGDVRPLPSGAKLARGPSASAVVKFGGVPKTLNVPVSGGRQPAPETPTPTTTTTTGVTATDDAKWFDLQKTFGPVSFKRVGLRYATGSLWFLLDASLTLAGLTISLDGLAFGSPLGKFKPDFRLDGLGIDFNKDPVEIAGSFLHSSWKDPTTNKTVDEYAGSVLIRTKDLTLSALGAYTDLGGNPSLFIYGVLNYPIGGPSFFYVTGLAAGFGYNRRLLAPTVDQVAAFPLVKNATSGAQPPQGKEDVKNSLRELRGSLQAEVGQYFLAIGIKFTSFKVVDSFALLTVGFGNELEIDVLGLSTAVVPTPVPGQPAKTPLARVQMALKASFLPAEGFLGVSAQLTSGSYILSEKCRLTGGFAFYTWFEKPRKGDKPRKDDEDHKGDFVLTVGGYHPDFKVPAHYPTVPRLGLNWQVTDQLTIKGDAYFALTASTFMAGGHLQVNWVDGRLRAWLNAGADFIVAWKPYHYDARMYVNVGASYTFEFFGRHQITVDVGAYLHLWGPEFSGTARIDLTIISFTIAFGAAAPPPPPILWDEFAKSFLPAQADVCTVAVKSGLIGKAADDRMLGVLNPKELTLAVATVIPVSEARWRIKTGDGDKLTEIGNGQFGIAPMNVGLGGAHSKLTIAIRRQAEDQPARADDPFVHEQFTCRPILKAMPTGLWGAPPPAGRDGNRTPDLNGERFIKDTLVGFELTPASPKQPGATASVPRARLADDPHDEPKAFDWGTPGAFTTRPLSGGWKEDIGAALSDQKVTDAREGVLSALGFQVDEFDPKAVLAGDFLVAPRIDLH